VSKPAAAQCIDGTGDVAEVDVEELTRDGDAVCFDYIDPFGRVAEGFVILWGGEYYAYRNLCPHWAVPMDRADERFVLPGTSFILCPMHGATFEIETGKCTSGPCEGDALDKLECELVQPGLVRVRRRRRLLTSS
jgi:nitrite reductase/ring-hydroxylating ferredoxin subunit